MRSKGYPRARPNMVIVGLSSKAPWRSWVRSHCPMRGEVPNDAAMPIDLIGQGRCKGFSDLTFELPSTVQSTHTCATLGLLLARLKHSIGMHDCRPLHSTQENGSVQNEQLIVMSRPLCHMCPLYYSTVALAVYYSSTD